MAKHYIDETLINAVLGKYKDSIPQKSPTSTTYSTISSLSVYSYQSGDSNNVISFEPNLWSQIISINVILYDTINNW